jgi:hypothetical protein
MPLIVTAQIVEPDTSLRAHRMPIDRATTLRDQRSQPHDVHVENLSATGCLLWSRVTLAPDARIRLGLSGGGVVEGMIIRRAGSRYGCRFTTPLSNDQLYAAFGPDAVIEGIFDAPVDHDDGTDRWPLPARGVALIGFATTAWVAIAVAVQSLRS